MRCKKVLAGGFKAFDFLDAGVEVQKVEHSPSRYVAAVVPRQLVFKDDGGSKQVLVRVNEVIIGPIHQQWPPDSSRSKRHGAVG